MSAVSGVNYTIALAPTPRTLLYGGQWAGKVRLQADIYEAASLAAASTINVASLPKDAIVLGNSFVEADALGSGHTISAGISGSAALFMAANEFNTALERKYFDAIGGIHYRCTTQPTIIILTTAAAVVTGTIVTEVLYAVE